MMEDTGKRAMKFKQGNQNKYGENITVFMLILLLLLFVFFMADTDKRLLQWKQIHNKKKIRMIKFQDKNS